MYNRSMSDRIIIPIEQRQIEFYEDMVTAVIAPDSTVYVPVKPLCELIGVTWQGQLERIKRDPVLSDSTMSISVTLIDIDETSRRPKSSDMVCLPLKYLNGWLFAINANRVKPKVKDVLMRYQRDCYDILHQAFTTGVAVRPDSDIMQSTEDTAVTYRTLVQLAKIAREQYYMGLKVEDHEKRLGLIEAQLSNPDAYVTNEEAQLISAAVKAIATVLGKQSGRNEFGAVYGELYQRYGVTSYKQIATSGYDEVMTWLRRWWIQLTDGLDVPF